MRLRCNKVKPDGERCKNEAKWIGIADMSDTPFIMFIPMIAMTCERHRNCLKFKKKATKYHEFIFEYQRLKDFDESSLLDT